MNQNTLNVGQRQTTGYDQSFYQVGKHETNLLLCRLLRSHLFQAEMAKAKAMIQQQYPGMYRWQT